MKQIKVLLITAAITVISFIPVLADITDMGLPATAAVTAVSNKEYSIGDIDNNASIDLADAQLSLKAALKIISLDTPAAKAADINKDGIIDLTDAQLTLKFALRILSVDNPYIEPDYIELFLTSMSSKKLSPENHSDTNFLSLYSYSPQITMEQLTGLAHKQSGIMACSLDDLHKQGLLSVPADKPLNTIYTIPNGALISFNEVKNNGSQTTISLSVTYGNLNGQGYESTFECQNWKWTLIETKPTWIS